MKSTFAKIALSLLALQVLVGCASSGSSPFFEATHSKEYANMYLRGVFNWWEVDEAFKLIASDVNEFSVSIELIADGQPYDFKVADATWSMTLNCGNAFDAKPMKLDRDVDLVCAADSLNLQFTPMETGIYQFILKVSNNASPELRITKVN